MRYIKIISGSYGHREGGKLIPKSRTSPAFAVDDDEAVRLVEIGVAEYVEEPVATVSAASFENEPSDNLNDEDPAEIDADEAEDAPKYDSSSTIAELKAAAAERGITFKVGMKKADLLALLNEDDEPAPLLGVEDPL